MADKNAFIDKVKITIKSGDGGDGMNSFKSFKGKPACGPDGGDGGNGGPALKHSEARQKQCAFTCLRTQA